MSEEVHAGTPADTDPRAARARELRERLEQGYAEPWDFSVHPALVGVVESYAKVATAYGDRVVCTIGEVEPPYDRRAVWLSQTALLMRFKELRPAQGELVAIRYLGVAEHAERGKSPAHRFRVEVDRPGGTFEWGSLEADDAPAPAPRPQAPAPAPRELTEAEIEEALRNYQPKPADDDIPF